MRSKDFPKNIANITEDTMHNVNSLTAQIEELRKHEQLIAQRKATAEDALINVDRQFKELHNRMDANETNHVKTSKVTRRISVAVLVVAILTLIATIVVPVLVPALLG